MGGVLSVHSLLHRQRLLVPLPRCAILALHLAHVAERVHRSGDLGMGKSTFARALIRALMDAPELEVPSPTFTLVQLYEAAPPLYHFDLYRLSDPDELIELGFDEALEDGISLIEWPERGGDMLPKNALTFVFNEEGEGRRVRLDGPEARLAELAFAFR